MLPLKIEGANVLMRGNDPQVSDLYVVELPGPIYVSRWEPTPEELAILIAGGSVEIHVMYSQPAMAVTASPGPSLTD